jgi:hypothetical protein
MSLFGDIAGLSAINAAYNRLQNVGTSAQSAANTLAGQLETKARFQPFSVTTGTSGANVMAGGSLAVGATGRAKQLQDALFSDALFNVGGIPPGYFETMGLGQDFLGMARPELQRGLPTFADTNELARQSLASSAGLLTEAGMSPAAREQAIYQRMRAAQTPEEERQRLALEERLLSQGRLGVSTNLYGGTPEQLALAKAQAEAQNTAMIQAMQQAQAERQMAGQLGAQFGTMGAGLGQAAQDLLAARQARGIQYGQAGLGMLSGQQALESAMLQRGLAATKAAFIPEAAALNALQQGIATAGLAQQAQQYGTGMFGEATMTGIDALLASGLGQANLLGNVGAGVLAAGASGSGEGGLFDFVKGIIDQISDVRLKENVEFIGKNQQGFNIYKWDWNNKANELGEFGSEVGVLAQELMETHPERVSLHDSGYYQVDYTGIWR